MSTTTATSKKRQRADRRSLKPGVRIELVGEADDPMACKVEYNIGYFVDGNFERVHQRTSLGPSLVFRHAIDIVTFTRLFCLQPALPIIFRVQQLLATWFGGSYAPPPPRAPVHEEPVREAEQPQST